MSFNSTVGAGAVSGFLDGGSVAGFEVEAVLSAFSGVFALVLDDFYDIVFVDPTKLRYLPFFAFKFIMSFIGKIKMPVLGNANFYL